MCLPFWTQQPYGIGHTTMAPDASLKRRSLLSGAYWSESHLSWRGFVLLPQHASGGLMPHCL